MEWIKWIMGLIGHIGLWCVVFNRIHATAWPRSTRKITEKAILLAVAVPLVWIASLLLLKRSLGFDTLTNFPLTFFYFYVCVLLGVFFICRWIWRQFAFPLPTAVIETKTEWIDMES